ncbi:TonB-dependent receptor [Sphingobium boeckii]|uniref:Iron complex outermembrane receptor protein n=1 Tax=Sphingobium boeckii TaxID=1082345 RepID=A0A7W9AFY1_9SPHN|nr:TonB-dependent receptor [Sphingobium boeckii]MBB5684955.1 iron complex outermembrane receptor protein [Sphingobium boeckii]
MEMRSHYCLKSLNTRLAYLQGVSAVAMALFIVQPGQAQAQTAYNEIVTPDDGEITVTARRRNESLQQVPLSVSAFTGDQLVAQGVTTLKDLNQSIPGLQYSDRGNLQTEITIRGIGGDSRNIGIESGVGMYIDGVYVARTSGYNADISDVQQVEVLRGPQGTLFGKNTIGGVINIVTKKPTETTEGFISASYGNYNAFRTQASLSGQIANNLFGKVTVATWDRDGYIYNPLRDEDLNNEDRRGGRAQLRWLPSEALEINLSADFTRDRKRTVLNQISTPEGAAAPYFTGDRFTVPADQRNLDNRDMWGTSLTVDYTLDSGAVLSSISAVRDIKLLIYSDADQLPIDLVHSGPFTDISEMYSQELRFVSPTTGPLKYVAGLYYFDQKSAGERTLSANLPAHFEVFNDAHARTKSYAAYVNADYTIAPPLTFTAGIRYTSERKTGDFFQTRPSLNYDLQDFRLKNSNVSWTGSVRYELSRNLTTYFSISRGFKSGGFNMDSIGAAGLIEDDLTFRPEKVTQYELGLKGRTSDNLLRFSAALFDLEYKNKQVAQYVSTTLQPVPTVQVTNAGQARVRGAELELTLKPVEGLTLSGNASYLDATYTSFPRAALIDGAYLNYTGNNIERTPEWTANGMVEYRHELTSGQIVGMGGVSYIGRTALQADNDPRLIEQGYTLFNSRLGYEASGGISVYLWVKNITNKDYRVFSRYFAGISNTVYGEPRTYGIDARYKF